MIQKEIVTSRQLLSTQIQHVQCFCFISTKCFYGLCACASVYVSREPVDRTVATINANTSKTIKAKVINLTHVFPGSARTRSLKIYGKGCVTWLRNYKNPLTEVCTLTSSSSLFVFLEKGANAGLDVVRRHILVPEYTINKMKKLILFHYLHLSLVSQNCLWGINAYL